MKSNDNSAPACDDPNVSVHPSESEQPRADPKLKNQENSTKLSNGDYQNWSEKDSSKYSICTHIDGISFHLEVSVQR